MPESKEPSSVFRSEDWIGRDQFSSQPHFLMTKLICFGNIASLRRAPGMRQGLLAPQKPYLFPDQGRSRKEYCFTEQGRAINRRIEIVKK